HPEVRHRIHSIRRDLQIEHGVAAVLLHRLDGVADVREASTQLVIAEIGEVDVVAEPVSGELHRGGGCIVTRRNTSSAPSCGLLRLRRTSSRISSKFGVAIISRLMNFSLSMVSMRMRTRSRLRRSSSPDDSRYSRCRMIALSSSSMPSLRDATVFTIGGTHSPCSSTSDIIMVISVT